MGGLEASLMLGGVHSVTGPVWGAAVFTWLADAASRSFDYWRAVTGAVILLLVLAFPEGLAGALHVGGTRRWPSSR